MTLCWLYFEHACLNSGFLATLNVSLLKRRHTTKVHSFISASPSSTSPYCFLIAKLTLLCLHLQTQHFTSLVSNTPHQHPHALPRDLSASIKNHWQLWLYLTNSWLRCPPPSSGNPGTFFFPVYCFSMRLLIFFSSCLACVSAAVGVAPEAGLSWMKRTVWMALR